MISILLFVFFATVISMLFCMYSGCIVLKIAKISYKKPQLLLVNSLWGGYALLLSCLYFINIFAPINKWSVLIMLVVLLTAGYFFARKELIDLASIVTYKNIILYALIVILCIIFIVSRKYSIVFDTMGYHLSIVDIANYFPAIPGVISMNPSFGHTYSNLYHVAALKIFGMGYEAIHYIIFVPSIMMLVGFVLLVCVHFFHTDFFNYEKKNSFYDKLFFWGIIVSSFLIIWYNYHEMRSILSDLTVYIIEFICIFYLLSFIRKSSKKDLFQLIILATLLLFVKLSSLVFVLIMAIIVSSVWFYKRKTYQGYVQYALFAFLLFVPFIILNIIKTGTVLFPVSFLDLNLPWSNKNAVYWNKLVVLLFARSQDMSLSYDWGIWFPQWLNDHKYIIKFFFYSYIILGSLYLPSLICNRKNKTLIKKSLYTLVLLIVIMFCLGLYWFFVTLAFRMTGILFLLPFIFVGALILMQIFNADFLNIFFSGKLVLKGNNLRVIIIVALVISTILQFEKKPLITEPIKDDARITKIDSYMYDGVKVFTPQEDEREQCGMRKKEELPCLVYPIPQDYTFKDPARWWKGVYKRDRLK